MLVARHQAFVAAPAQSVWDLLGDARRHPEWWPEIVEIRGCQSFGHGCSFCQVAREGDEVTETEFEVERLEDLKELMVRCSQNGTYMRWLLTEARDGTFVDAEFGMDPDAAAGSGRELDLKAERDRLRRWLQSSLDGLAGAAATAEAAS